MLHGFETSEATFLTRQQTGTEEDAYGDVEPVYGWLPELENVSVRFQPGSRVGQGYEETEIGALVAEEPKIFAEPDDVGHDDDGVYVLDIEVNDRVEVDAPGAIGEMFRVMQVKPLALDSRTPEVVEFALELLEGDSS